MTKWEETKSTARHGNNESSFSRKHTFQEKGILRQKEVHRRASTRSCQMSGTFTSKQWRQRQHKTGESRKNMSNR